MILVVERHDNIAFLVRPVRRLGHMRARLFLAFAQILAERGGEFFGVGFGHAPTIRLPALTRPHAFFIGLRLSENSAAVAQW